MSELKEVVNVMQVSGERIPSGYYKKSEADQYIEELEESHKKEVEQLLMEIVELNHKVEHWKTWYKQAAEF